MKYQFNRTLHIITPILVGKFSKLIYPPPPITLRLLTSLPEIKGLTIQLERWNGSRLTPDPSKEHLTHTPIRNFLTKRWRSSFPSTESIRLSCFSLTKFRYNYFTCEERISLTFYAKSGSKLSLSFWRQFRDFQGWRLWNWNQNQQWASSASAFGWKGIPEAGNTLEHEPKLSCAEPVRCTLAWMALRASDGTSSSLRRCSSLVHVHQNELVRLVQSFNFSQKNEKEWLNCWTSLNIELVQLACIQATKYDSNEKLPNLF